MDENINNTMVDDEQINDVEETEEYTSNEDGISVLPVLAVIGAGVGGFILGRKLKIGDKIKEARINHAKKVLEAYSKSDDAGKTQEVEDAHFVYTNEEGK